MAGNDTSYSGEPPPQDEPPVMPSSEELARTVVQKLKTLYMKHCKSVERASFFSDMHLAPMTESEIEARPQVLLIGQYSTGKTSFIKWLTNIDSPFFDIRPQPSTDKFMAIVHGDEEKVIKGDAATCLPQLPYQGLSRFGKAFLQRFEALVEPAAILDHVTFVDTPGVLSGDKQRISRGYDFVQVCQFMAQRSDLIILLFDAHKLDISDELKEVIEAIKPEGDKVRCVLNKADQIDAENLVRVFGALMWNLGKVLRTPEVARVFIGSFWNKEYRFRDHEALFNSDKKDLLTELRDLPKNVAVRKINELVARIRLLIVHLAIVAKLRDQLPTFSAFGAQQRRQKWLADNLDSIFQEVKKQHNVSEGDLPDKEELRGKLLAFPDFSKFPKWNKDQVVELEKLVDIEIPRLMALIGGVSASSLRDLNQTVVPSRDSKSGHHQKHKGGSGGVVLMFVALLFLVLAVVMSLIVAGKKAPEPLRGIALALRETARPLPVVGQLARRFSGEL